MTPPFYLYSFICTRIFYLNYTPLGKFTPICITPYVIYQIDCTILLFNDILLHSDCLAPGLYESSGSGARLAPTPMCLHRTMIFPFLILLMDWVGLNFISCVRAMGLLGPALSRSWAWLRFGLANGVAWGNIINSSTREYQGWPLVM